MLSIRKDIIRLKNIVQDALSDLVNLSLGLSLQEVGSFDSNLLHDSGVFLY